MHVSMMHALELKRICGACAYAIPDIESDYFTLTNLDLHENKVFRIILLFKKIICLVCVKHKNTKSVTS